VNDAVQAVTTAEVLGGLSQVLDLVEVTHWIKGQYLNVEYLDGDGAYEDGAIVEDSKVVGCLVGLARLVGAKQPTYYVGEKRDSDRVQGSMAISDLSQEMERAMLTTIRDEFLDGYFADDDDEEDEEGFDRSETSIEGWNDAASRTKPQVIEMVKRTIERVQRGELAQ
jgi:hypothetical protein